MNADILNDLAARVEALAGANYAIEVEIFQAFHPEYAGYVQGRGSLVHPCDGSDQRVLSDVRPGNYTASIDSAMTLLPPDAFWRVGHDADDPAWMMAQVSYDRGEGRLGFTTGTAETAAMAMTAAALRAHAAIAKENER